MSRELKFRVWDNKLKEMNLFLKIENGEDLMHFSCINTDKNRFEIMQFTGLSDANGKEIYEGDILEINGDFEQTTKCDPFIFEVVFNEGAFQIRQIHKESTYQATMHEFIKFMKIVGNIYENHELLEKE